VRVWNLRTGTPIGEPLTDHTDWDPQAGRRLGEPRPDLEAYRLLTGTPEPPTQHEDLVCTVLDDVPVVVIGSFDGTVRVCDLRTGTPIGRPFLGYPDARLLTVACTVIDSVPVVLTGGYDGTVRVSDLRTRTTINPLLLAPNGVLAVACTVVDGTPVAVTGHRDGTVGVWDLATSTFTRHHDGTVGATRRLIGEPLTGHTDEVRSVACTVVDGTPVAVTGSNDTTVRVWDLTTRTLIGSPTAGHNSDVRSVACTVVDGTPVAVSRSLQRQRGPQDQPRVWDLRTGLPMRRLHLPGPPYRMPPNYAVWSLACAVVDGTPVAITGGGERIIDSRAVEGAPDVWDLRTNICASDPQITRYISDKVHSVACADVDGTPVAVTIGDGCIRMWDLRTRTLIREPHYDRGSMRVVVCTVLDGTPVAVTGGVGIVKMWNLRTRTEIGKSLLTSPRGIKVCALACTVVDGTPVAVVGGDDGMVRVWDLRTRTLIGEPLAAHTREVLAVVCMAMDGIPVAISGGGDGMVRLWDLRTGKSVGRLMVTKPGAIAVSPQGDLILGREHDVAVFRRRSA
jgi:WD40 repeat protein